MKASVNIWIVAVLVSLSACSGGLNDVRLELAKVKKSQSDIRSRQADHTSSMVSIEERIRLLSGRVDEIEYLQRSRVGVDINSLKRDISSLEKRVPPPAIVPLELLESDEELAAKLSPQISGMFSDALGKIRAGKFEEALIDTERALSLAYGIEGTNQLLFWKGVSFDGLGENRRSLETYHEMLRDFPKHERTASGLLRLASVFIRLEDTATAKVTLHKLLELFPNSEEGKLAKKRLKEIK